VPGPTVNFVSLSKKSFATDSAIKSENIESIGAAKTPVDLEETNCLI